MSFGRCRLADGRQPPAHPFGWDHRISKVPVLGWLFKLAKAIPVAPQKEDPQAYQAAFDGAAQVLRRATCCTSSPKAASRAMASCKEFKGGIMKILERAQADGVVANVIPHGADQPVGLVFQPYRTGRRHGCGPSDGACSAAWGLNVGSAVAQRRDVQPRC